MLSRPCARVRACVLRVRAHARVGAHNFGAFIVEKFGSNWIQIKFDLRRKEAPTFLVGVGGFFVAVFLWGYFLYFFISCSNSFTLSRFGKGSIPSNPLIPLSLM